MIKKAFLLLFIISNFASPLYALEPIVPSQVLSTEEISHIRKTGDFFFVREMDFSTPIWKGTKRKYSSHYLKDRTSYFTLDDVIHRTLTDGFPIQNHVQRLYRAKMGIHSMLGSILPKLNIIFGNSALGTPIDQVFTGAVGFLLPSNWMRLANQVRIYKATKSILLKSVLDQILAAKLIYLQQHQILQEFEILNFYFIHLQIFCETPLSFLRFQNGDRFLNTLMGQYAVLGTRMATLRSRAKLGFDDLANFMALEKSHSDYTTSAININDIDNFPDKVKDLEELDEIYTNKQRFLEKVVQRSIELKIIDEFAKISKLDIGISAFGNIFSPTDVAVQDFTDATFAFQFGYNTLPNILIAKSFYDTAKIDVRSEYIKMLDNARRSFDLYTNALESYTEALRSLKLNRLAFKQNVLHTVETNQAPDGLFPASLLNLIESELSFNSALHASLIARAFMDRFLLIDDNSATKYLPENGQIIKLHEEFVQIYTKEKQTIEEIDVLLKSVRKSSELKKILYETANYAGKSEDLKELRIRAVKRNIGNLLYSKITFFKSKNFYQVLSDFIYQNNIDLTFSEESILHKKLQS